MPGNVQYERLVEDLAVKHRAKEALRQLLAAGPLATEAVRQGLWHADPAVRVGCCVVLDHHLDEDALPGLIANLTHDVDEVRSWALHALACDRCKEGTCRPAEDDVLPMAIRMLLEDESFRVRRSAAALVGQCAFRRADACRALERARECDPDPTVRKIAGWYTPGGPIYRRLLARSAAARRVRPKAVAAPSPEPAPVEAGAR